MPRICGSKEAMRQEYSWIKLMEQEIERKKKEIAVCEALIKSSKAAIRNTYKLEEQRANEPHWESYNTESGWDSRHKWEVYDFIFTEEDEKEYREEEWWHWYNPYGDGRDCTGVWFTNYISIFRIPEQNKTIVYHSQSMDV